MLNESGKIVLVLVLLLLLFGAVVYLLSPSLKKQGYIEKTPGSLIKTVADEEANKLSELTKDYYSKNFKMKIASPGNFQVEDNFPIFVFSNGLKKIDIARNGTNFNTLAEYIKDFDIKRKVREVNRQEKTINNYPVLEREIAYDGKDSQQKSIYLYIDNYVYIFSTSDESLYPILDQIVESFEYKP